MCVIMSSITGNMCCVLFKAGIILTCSLVFFLRHIMLFSIAPNFSMPSQNIQKNVLLSLNKYLLAGDL